MSTPDPGSCPNCGTAGVTASGARLITAQSEPLKVELPFRYVQRVVVSGVEIPFGELVGLLIKLGLAAIPAGIIMTLVWLLLGGLLSAIVGGIAMAF